MSKDDVNNSNYASQSGWQADDFIDTTTESLIEDDPWLDLPSGDRGEIEDISDFEMSERPIAPRFDDNKELFEDEYGDGLDDTVDDGSEWDEPEIFAEYDDDLHEDLYILNEDVSDLSLSRKLKIDEFISTISPSTDTQRDRISNLLESLSLRRLSNWLPWLREKDWTGQSLSLFLDFRLNYWEENPEWWEHTFWHSRLDNWWTYSNPAHTLSLEAAYRLVQDRLHYPADKIIDISWLEDWRDYNLWKYGFPSFALFAVFRAHQTGNREDWREVIVSSSKFESDHETLNTLYGMFDLGAVGPLISNSKWRVWDDNLPYRTLGGSSQWFAVQDWYDPSEWHDNLGWI